MKTLALILALAGLLVGIGSIKGAQIGQLIAYGEAAAAAGPPPEAVSVHTVQDTSVDAKLHLIGTVAADRGVAVSNATPGVLASLAFESGAQVRKGEVIARLDTSVERAALDKARAQERLAAQNLKRSRPLAGEGHVAATRIDNDEAALRQAQAEVKRLKAEIELKVVRAPFDGRLGIRKADLGQYLAPGTELVTLQASDSLWIDFSVPQRFLAELDVDDQVSATWPGHEGEPVEGRVRAIAPNVATDSRTVLVRAELETAPTDDLRPGMYVEVDWLIDTAVRPVVPPTALVRAKGDERLFVVVERDGREYVERRSVHTGASVEEGVAVTEGLKAGERVVSQGVFKLYDGAPIMAVAPEQEAAR